MAAGARGFFLFVALPSRPASCAVRFAAALPRAAPPLASARRELEAAAVDGAARAFVGVATLARAFNPAAADATNLDLPNLPRKKSALLEALAVEGLPAAAGALPRAPRRSAEAFHPQAQCRELRRHRCPPP